MKLQDIVYWVEKFTKCKSDVETIEEKLSKVRTMKGRYLRDDDKTVFISKEDMCLMLEDFLKKKKCEELELVHKEIL